MIGNNDDFYGSDIGENNDRDGFDANTINTNMPALPSSNKLVADLLEAIKDDVKEGIKRELNSYPAISVLEGTTILRELNPLVSSL